MTEKKMTDMEALEEAVRKFREPLEFSELDFRVGAGKQILPYINSRCAFDRLDKCFGLGWHSSVEKSGDGFICSITLSNGNAQVTRSDGANESDIEGYKGGISDAIKRTCHQFGLGRELYSWPKIVIVDMTKEDKYVPFEVLKKLEVIADTIRAKKSVPNWIYFKKDGTRCDKYGNPTSKN